MFRIFYHTVSLIPVTYADMRGLAGRISADVLLPCESACISICHGTTRCYFSAHSRYKLCKLMTACPIYALIAVCPYNSRQAITGFSHSGLYTLFRINNGLFLAAGRYCVESTSRSGLFKTAQCSLATLMGVSECARSFFG